MTRKHRVEVRLNRQKYRALEEYADKFGITRSEAIRKLIHQLWDNIEIKSEAKNSV